MSSSEKDDGDEHKHGEVEFYGDPGIYSADAPVPGWLKWTYVVMPIIGFIWFYFFWNGSYGWLDRGHWKQLEEAAKTTFPKSRLMP